jgi:glycine oxidase
VKTVLIAGAGIIGLSIALELAAHGVEVTVLERGMAMREASWAAAGMLAANDPENPPPLAPLAHLSLSLYPAFLRSLAQLSGHRIPLRTTHTLQICHPGEAHNSAARSAFPCKSPRLSFAEAARLVPGLGPKVAGEFLWLEESSLDPRDLCRTLPVAARAAGVRLFENCPVDSLHVAHDSVTAITPESRYEADALVLCCGAWSRSNWSKANADAKFVRADASLCIPKKGQMLSVRMPSGLHIPRLETVLRSPDIYLVPRGSPNAGADEGLIIIGATVEDAGFDRGIHADATAWLMKKAASLWPPIQEAQLDEVWTGIRPGTPDDLPLIGPVGSGNDASQVARLWVATGHYRNGILLAPGTARVVASSLLANRIDSPPVDLLPFRPSRFQATADPLILEQRLSVIL